MDLHRHSNWTGAILLCGLLAFGAGCSHDNGQGGYVAKVGQTELSQEELGAFRTSPDSSVHPNEYINDWVTTELLYREAERRGIAQSEAITRQLEAMKKRLAVAALLNQEIYGTDSTVNEDAIVTYFNAAKNSFALHEDAVLLSWALFVDREAANTFRSRVLSGTAWDKALAEAEANPSHARLVSSTHQQYYTASTLYPEELWKVARTLRKEDVSFAVKTDQGYYVLKLHAAKRKGEIPDLDFVRDEVRERVLMETRRLKYERLLTSLRSRYPVDIRTSVADSSAD